MVANGTISEQGTSGQFATVSPGLRRITESWANVVWHSARTRRLASLPLEDINEVI